MRASSIPSCRAGGAPRARRRSWLVAGAAGAALAAAQPAPAQMRGAVELDQAIRHFTTTARVLVIAAHPDDEDTQAIAWLTRGKGVETAYLSLTRGDGGQNLIGNELGEALGAIRTEELLAARRIDGGRQYFTRAFDFGFSKNAEETEKHWPRDTILADVVTVIRAFRPHVIYAIWSGTRADGHGHHEYSGQVARAAFDAAGDTVRFPVARHGVPWEPLKFYRRGAGIALPVNDYDPVLGRTYASIAAESRSQHRSQGFAGVALRSIVPGGGGRGFGGSVVREASRVNDATPANAESSIFDGVDTTFARLVTAAPGPVRIQLATVAARADSVLAVLDLANPAPIVPTVARIAGGLRIVRAVARPCRDRAAAARMGGPQTRNSTPCTAGEADLDAALETLQARAQAAVLAASQIEIDAIAPRALMAFGDSVTATVAIVNHGKIPVTVSGLAVTGGPRTPFQDVTLPPDSGVAIEQRVIGYPDLRPWWTGGEREEGYFEYRRSPADGVARVSSVRSDLVSAVAVSEERRRFSDVWVTLELAGETILVNAGPLVERSADPLLGVQDRPLAGVPKVTFAFPGVLEWIPAGKPINRWMRLTVKSYADSPQTLKFGSLLPAGVRLDSLPASITLGPGEQREVLALLRGRVAEGQHAFGIYGEDSSGTRLTQGFFPIAYPHIRPIHMYKSSALWLRGVNVSVPPNLTVAYIQGVGDVSHGYLRQLDIPVTLIKPGELAQWDLKAFTTVVVGPRALEADPALAAYAPRLLQFARDGGTLVVQYGQTFPSVPALFPYPMEWASRPQRVTMEDAPVTVLDPQARILNYPNRIGPDDWNEWVQERALYMPGTIDPRYATPIEMHDPDEPANRGGIVTARVGKGTFVYTSLALFRQLPGAVPGSARLFVNLLSAGLAPAGQAVP